MGYLIGDLLTSQQEKPQSGNWCAIFDSQEAQSIPGLAQPQRIRFCKVEEEEDQLSGTICIPGGINKEKICFSFLLRSDELLFAEQGDFLKKFLPKLHLHEAGSSSGMLCTVLQALIGDDLSRIESLEDRNSKLETSVLSGTLDNFDHKMMALRKEILALSHYYMQLEELCSLMQENSLHLFSKRELTSLRSLSQRICRLWNEIKMLNDYSMQICEVYQAQISIRQNKIMKILTIVTTVFLPLSLIVGWYGMNFAHMPELTAPGGYGIICVVCLLLIAVEIWIFKKKGWFK